MAMDVGEQGKGPRPSINITPLVDVVLVLLIIFMVVTPLLTKHFSTRVPEKAEPSEDSTEGDEDAIVVTLDVSGAIHLNSARVPMDALEARLRSVFAKRTERIVFFDASDETRFGDAVEVLDHTRAGGAEQIAIATEAMNPSGEVSLAQ